STLLSLYPALSAYSSLLAILLLILILLQRARSTLFPYTTLFRSLMNARKHSYLVFKVQMKKDLHFLQKMHIIVLVFPKFMQCLVAIAKRSHLFPYRTQQLSSSAPMVVGAL